MANEVKKIGRPKTLEITIEEKEDRSPKLIPYLIYKSASVLYDQEKSIVFVNGIPAENPPGEKHMPGINLAEDKSVEIYRTFLSRHFENIVVLTGAGSSVGIGEKGKEGQTMNGLWGKIVESVNESAIKTIASEIAYEIEDITKVNLEEFLSKANLFRNLYLEKTCGNFQATIKEIEKVIVENCSLVLPPTAPHKEFLRRLTSRKLNYNRIKLFTTNYDLLFEQAATAFGYSVIDGFSFTYPRIFNGNNFDYDIVLRKNSRVAATENYAKNVFHLYKLHGSLDWKRDEKKQQVIKCDIQANTSPIMIFPRSSKYETSYEQPFFEMMTRFQAELRMDNALLLIIGYSFGDKHINSMISEALNVNHSLQLVLVDVNINNENFTSIAQQADQNSNIMLINSTFDKFVSNFPYAGAYDYIKTQEGGDGQSESI